MWFSKWKNAKEIFPKDYYGIFKYRTTEWKRNEGISTDFFFKRWNAILCDNCNKQFEKANYKGM